MRFKAEIAKRGQAACKYGKCKEKIEKGLLRIGKISPSPFAEGSELTQWFHVKCLFEQMKNPRASKLESTDELEGFDELEDSDKQLIENHIQKLGEEAAASGTPKSGKKKVTKKNKKDEDEVSGGDEEDESPKKKQKVPEKKKSRKSKKKAADDDDEEDD